MTTRLRQRVSNLPGAFWGCLIIAFGLRLIGLSKGFRGDEMGTLVGATLPLPEMLQLIAAHDAHPPLAYVVYHVWLQGGMSEAWARFPTVLLGMALCAMTYLMVRGRLDGRTSLTAMWLVAIAPLSIFLSQTVRSYMFAAAILLGAMWSVLKMFEEDTIKRGPGLAYLLLATLALYTFYFSVFPLIAINLTALWTWRHRRDLLSRWALLQVGVATLFLPWLPTLMRQMMHVSDRLFYRPGFFIGGVYLGGIARGMAGLFGVDDALFVDRNLAVLWPRPVLYAIAVTALAAVLVIGWAGFRGLKAQSTSPRFPGLIVSVAIMPISLAAIAHLVSGITLFQRYLYVSFVPMAVLFAGALSQVGSKRLRAVILTGLSLLCLVRIGYLATWKEVDWKGAAAYLEAHRQAGDTLLYVIDHRVQHYVSPGLDRVYLDPPRFFRSASVGFQIPPATTDQLLASRRLWVARVSTFLHRLHNTAIQQWLEAHQYAPGESRSFGNLRLTLYQRQ